LDGGDNTESPPIINVVGDRVALGPVRRDLLATYYRWINDFTATRNLLVAARPMSLEQETTWFEHVASDEKNPSFTIYDRQTWQPIGNTGLDVDHTNRSAVFGILIGEISFRGRGYGTETTRLMLDYAFTGLGLNNVMLTVFEYNLAGRRAYEKAGFREFGRRRQSRQMGGRLWDEIYMDCIAADFTGTVLNTIFAPDEPRT
jgi:RimJ/RimL family protein N-acetyltransferase